MVENIKRLSAEEAVVEKTKIEIALSIILNSKNKDLLKSAKQYLLNIFQEDKS